MSSIVDAIQTMDKRCSLKRTGACCCTCIHEVHITYHPQNEVPYKGSISDVFAWGCNVRGKEIMLFDKPHGECELWTPVN